MRGHYASCAAPLGCSCEVNQYLVLFALGIIATAVQSVGVMWQASLSLAGDTAHVFTDTLDLLLAVFIARAAQGMTHDKEEQVRKIAGFVSAGILCFVAYEIVTHAIERLKEPRVDVYWSMILAGSVGLAINLYQMWRIRMYPHDNVTYRRIALHVGSDMWISVVVVGGGIVMGLSGFGLIDPVASIGVALWLLYHLFRHAREEGHCEHHHGHAHDHSHKHDHHHH